nr:EOG090X0IKC [Macrothrix elegans]
MVKTKKTRKRKTYLYNVNRRKLKKKDRKRKFPRIQCDPIREEWQIQMSVKQNLNNMGLLCNANEVLPIGSEKEGLPTNTKKKKTRVIKKLEEEAYRPRDGTLKIPKQTVNWIEYLLDKYGDDFEAMARDKNNHYQETPAQLRKKIKDYVKRPAYMVKYLKERGKLPVPTESKN